jgi:hypothetical protein
MESESQTRMIIEMPITLIDENGAPYKVTALINNITGEVNHVPPQRGADCVLMEEEPDG